MSIQHKDIPEAQLHEPKGVSVAAANTAYVANGSGSGAWTAVQIAACADIRAVNSVATTGITTGYQAINNANLGGTITWTSTLNSGMTLNTTLGHIQVATSGTYEVDATLGVIPATANSVWSVTIGVDSGAGIVSKEATILATVSTSGIADTIQISVNNLISLTASDKVYVMLKEASGKEITTLSVDFHLIRVV